MGVNFTHITETVLYTIHLLYAQNIIIFVLTYEAWIMFKCSKPDLSYPTPNLNISDALSDAMPPIFMLLKLKKPFYMSLVGTFKYIPLVSLFIQTDFIRKTSL